MPRTLEPEPLRRPAKFAHFVLRVRNLEESISWYQIVLGMTIVHRHPKLVFLTYDEEHHRLAMVETPVDAGKPGAPGLDHVAYTMASLGDLLATYVRLARKGITPVWCVNHGPTTSLYYADPDGNRVELQHDNYDTEEALKGWMQSGAFEKNPVGVEFDPHRLIERYEAGDAIELLIQQGSA